MQTKAFFGTEGLTSTSANHVANLAKEANREHQNYLDSIQFYAEHIKVLGDAESTLVQDGLNSGQLVLVENAIDAISKNNALIAFLREAIKEKERLEKEAKGWKNTVARDALALRRKENVRPVKKDYVTEEEIRSKWSIGELEHYLSLEADCAVVGKYIHEGGSLSNARIDAMQKLTHPRSVKENGRDTIVTEYKLTVEPSSIDNLYFCFQSRHRSRQAELNGMKKAVLDDVQACNLKIDEEFRTANTQYLHVDAELDREERKIEMDENEKRQILLCEVQALKIVLPNRLKETYNALMNSGK
jgi:hypothetical protein